MALAFDASPLGAYDTHRKAAVILSEKSRPLSVLEIGCGTGAGLKDFARLFPNHQFTGLDISEVNIARAKASSGSIRWVATNLMNFEDRGFDLIIAESALQNIACSASNLAARLAELAAYDATIIVSMPFACARTAAMVFGRRVAARVRTRLLDAIALKLAKRLYPAWTREALAARLEYVYLPIHHYEGGAFSLAMERTGFQVQERLVLHNPSFAKPPHSLTVYRFNPRS